VEHRKADVRQVASRGASGDDPARFLRELRQLRDGAGLGQAELAARAHFPYDSIRAAEVGPALPDLPVLSAYVRGCGGTTEEWEERWRSLTRSPSLPVPASRHAGRSDAATAGARIGSVSSVGDSPDPSIIIAALDRVAEEMASSSADPVSPSPAVPAVPDFPSSEAPLPSVPEPFPSTPEPRTSDTPAGWDPIRVSTAWPAIRDTPMVAAESASATQLSGAAAPWEAAPWAEGPLDATPPATGAVSPGVVSPGAAGSAAPAAGATSGDARAPEAAAGYAPAAAGASGRSSSQTRVVVIAAVLLCVLAVLLAIFA
jgi:hypothetical protein